MKNRIIFATGNPHKVRETGEILKDFMEVVSMRDIGVHEDIPETKPTLEGCALQKARYLADNYGVNCFSEDTGLEVDALNGEPGVLTARYAGPAKNAQANMDLLLQKLGDSPNRTAQFRTIIALLLNGKEYLFEGIVKGQITQEKIGKGGFGYDPIFQPDGYATTFAALPSEVKHGVSHRSRALDKLVAFLKQPALILLVMLSYFSIFGQEKTQYANLERYQAANDTVLPPKPDEQRVVIIGNSIMEGWVKVDSAFFAANDFIGRGISGQTSDQLLLRFRQDVLNLSPELVVINIGINDIAENNGPYDESFTFGNIQSMVELARFHNIKVILASVLPATEFRWRRKLGDCSAKVLSLNDKIRNYAAGSQIPYLDYHSMLKNQDNGMDKELAEDGVHPTKQGYELMKNLALPFIKKVLVGE